MHNNQHSPRKILISKIRLRLWRWHRRIGLLSALFVMLLASTGILLNHGNSLGLDAKFLPQSLLSFFYRIDTPAIVSVQAEQFYVSQVGNRSLYLQANSLGECSGDLLGLVPEEELLLVACSNKLLLTTIDGQLVDQVDEINGIPLPIAAVGRCGSVPCWQAQNQLYQLDIDSMQWTITTEPLQSLSTKIATPKQLREQIISNYGGEISWERWLQDLHSGRLFGRFGPLLMDGMAILFMVLALTGVVMWTLGRRRQHR